ncbi:unnamed protein product, partial [Porites lobata]
MTDGLITDQIQHNLILKEKDKYKDIKLQPLKGGRGWFGFRFLNQIKWAAAKFNFQYLLRIDDDYFLCYSEVFGAERKLDVVSSTSGPTSHVVAEQYSKHNILPRY